MTAKKLTLAAALLLGASLGLTTASLAQGGAYGPGYYGGAYGPGYYGGPYGRTYYGGTYDPSYNGQNYYDYAPGPGYAPYNDGPAASDCDRGGSGPRVGCGSGMGIGSQR
jgi:hypothetical protein